ncbi:MAG TPA: hypothetical protein VNJ04_11760 [Gemmatimonadaceae bacterium]|nr:hypothetical protein [Gemmatimonadaceae bacterium]
MTIKSRALGPGSLKFGATGTPREFSSQLRKAELAPDIKDGELLDVLSGEQISEVDEETWSIGGTVLQDYDLDSLEMWCWENKGSWVPFTFTPNNEGTQSWKGEARIQPIKVGGDVKTRNTSDFTFQAKNIAPVATADLTKPTGRSAVPKPKPVAKPKPAPKPAE